jgi:hypothetical protein
MKRLAVLVLVLMVSTVGCSGSHAASGAITRPNDKGFQVLDVQLKQDALGYLSGTAEVQNKGGHTHSAAMRFTFRQNGKVVARATSLARLVAVGQTVTVDLASTDKWDGRPVTYTFQVTNLY